MAHDELWEQLEIRDRTKTASRSKSRYLDNPERFILVFLNTEYIIDLTHRQIYTTKTEPAQKQSTYLEQLCLLAYLINASDLPPTNELTKAERLSGGQFFFRGLHSLPTDKLNKTFGNRPELLHKIAYRFNAHRCEFGDVSIRLNVLPRLPLTIIIWSKCEEFSARSSILFDKNAASQMPLDALLVAVNLTVDALIKVAEDYS